MAEVLTKTEKYINGEEALLSKQRSSSTQKEKSRGDKERERSPRRQDPIWDYLVEGTLASDPKEASKLRQGR